MSLSYTPWLRQLTNDIHLSYLSGYYKVNDQHVVGGSLRFFSLGEITFTDENANYIREDKPSEFELTGAYAFRTSERTSVGVNAKFVYSNLTGGMDVQGVNTKPGIAGAADISFSRRCPSSEQETSHSQGHLHLSTREQQIIKEISRLQAGISTFARTSPCLSRKQQAHKHIPT